MNILLLIFFFPVFLSAQSGACASALTKYVPLPESVFLPASQIIEAVDALHFAGANHVAEKEKPLREHGWKLFEALTRPVSPDCSEPVWRTWLSEKEALNPAGCIVRSPSSSSYLQVQSSTMFDPKILNKYQAERGMVLRNVLFNHHVCESIKTRGILAKQSLISLYKSGEHDIPALSPKSVALKTNWRVVKKGKVLNLGVWNDSDGIALDAGKPRYGIRVPESTWSACTLVKHDPLPTGKHQCGVNAKGKKVYAKYTSIGEFYHVTVGSSTELKFMRDLIIDPDQKSALAIGDTLILVGFHVTTREIPDWFWATFWWKPAYEQNPPEAAGKPASLYSPWNNYVMDVTASLRWPTEMDGGLKVMFNPYIEAALSEKGTGSNCMACHARAAYCSTNDDRFKVNVDSQTFHRNTEPISYFERKLRTDFLWSLASVVTEQLGKCPN